MLFETKPVNVKFQLFFYHFEKSGQQHWSVYLSQDENINFRHYLLFQTELNDLIDYFTTNHRNFCKLQLLVYHCTFSQFAKQVSSESILGVSGYWLSNPKEKRRQKSLLLTWFGRRFSSTKVLVFGMKGSIVVLSFASWAK